MASQGSYCEQADGGGFPGDRLNGEKLLLIAKARQFVLNKRPHLIGFVVKIIEILYGLQRNDAQKAWSFVHDHDGVVANWSAADTESLAKEEWEQLQ